MIYRREIDGLRALAVLPVILFHAGFETFSGGFVGVDVFFVISGYLITTIIFAELEQGKFSLLNFYERRARRILPALILVVLVCIPLAWLWLLPDHFLEFSRSIVSVALFSSNFLFWQEVGYFANAAAEKPLLHTWSLAVEEQFYVLFPLFVILTWRLGKHWVIALLAVVFVTSLAVAQWASLARPAAAFYLLPTRVWELLFGAFSAFYLVKADRIAFGRVLSEVGSWLGVVLILYAVFAYSKATPFPGFYALVPTVGAALVILFATHQTSVGKFLGNFVLVSIGLISYGAYLWHQPLFAFAKYKSLDSPSTVFFLVLSALSIMLAYASWRFVEKPFRFGDKFSRSAIVKMSICSFFVLILCGALGSSYGGFPSRLKFYPENEVSELALKAVMDQYGSRSYPTPKSLVKDSATGLWRMGAHTGSGVLLVGDSHSTQYLNTFDEVFNQAQSLRHSRALYVQQLSFLPDFDSLNLAGGRDIDVVVISYFWSLRYGSSAVNQYIRCCGNGPKGIVGRSSPPKSGEQMDSYDKQLGHLIDELSKRSIRTILVLDNPFGEELNPKSMLKIDGLNVYPTKYFRPLSREIATARSEPVRSRLMRLAKDHGAEVIDPFNFLCDEMWCNALSKDGFMRYKDYDHISLMTATKEASYILKVLDSR